MRLKGKVALVTGAARGLGFAIARRFALEGAKVMLVGRQAVTVAEACERIAAETGAELASIEADVGCGAQVSAAVQACIERFGRIDIAVANAGIIRNKDVLDLTEDDFDEVMRVNLKGVFLTDQAAARVMVAQDPPGGSIINLTSVNDHLTMPTFLPYATSKAGILGITRTFAVALADRGIRVNGVGPGSCSTEMFLDNTVNQDPEFLRKVLSRTPARRLGHPDEIASVAVFLASDDSSFVNGETIYADGGRTPLAYTLPVTEEQIANALKG
ncbi:SDR family NAD(P)-dependent oxidoreductase [Pseudomonas tolaasii]